MLIHRLTTINMYSTQETLGDFPNVLLPFNLERLIVFVLLFFIIPNSKQDLDEAFGRNGHKTL